MKVDALFFGISGHTWLRLIYRSDDTLKLIAEKTTTSDRLMEMIPTGGQTEAVRPGYDLHFGLTRYRGLNFTPLRLNVFYMKASILIMFFTFLAFKTFAQEPHVSSGRLDRVKSFPSAFVEARNVDIWLPEGYSRKKKYAVLYMHDGQMLYDSTTTWNKKAWEADDVAAELMKEKKVKEFIIVGIWNGGPKRHAEYFPQKPFESLPQSVQDTLYGANRSNGDGVFKGNKVQSDKYLLFLVKELKPYIDKKYSTRKDPANTIIAGSSMGGLISMYAICEYPEVFGGAACMSTHWPGIFYMNNNPVPEAFFNYLESHLPDPKTHKLYFDHGTATLDAMYPPLQKKVDVIMKAKGYDDVNWLTKVFPGEDHSETAWRKRLYIPLEFLLSNTVK